MNRRLMQLGAAVAIMLTSAVGAARAADTSDSWVTMKTKVSLMTTEGVSTSDLNVDTVKGVVTLHGKVPSEGQKERAGDVARRIDGVREVKNLLQVVPKSERAVVERSDDQIKDGVEAAFKANRRINESGIKVASVNKGVVLLSGKTKSWEANLESVQVADAVRGVRRVSTEVEVVSGSSTSAR
jgi:hyperosmotically inducible periplasmic protein